MSTSKKGCCGNFVGRGRWNEGLRTREESGWKRKTWIDDSTLSRTSVKRSYHFPRLSLSLFFFLDILFLFVQTCTFQKFLAAFWQVPPVLQTSRIFYTFFDFYFFFVWYPFSVVDPRFNFSFLIPPWVTFGLGAGIEMFWRVLFYLRQFCFISLSSGRWVLKVGCVPSLLRHRLIRSTSQRHVRQGFFVLACSRREVLGREICFLVRGEEDGLSVLHV